MRYWNGLKENDIVYYNDETDKEYRVIALYEKDNKRFCKIERTDDRSIIKDVEVKFCNKKDSSF